MRAAERAAAERAAAARAERERQKAAAAAAAADDEAFEPRPSRERPVWVGPKGGIVDTFKPTKPTTRRRGRHSAHSNSQPGALQTQLLARSAQRGAERGVASASAQQQPATDAEPPPPDEEEVTWRGRAHQRQRHRERDGRAHAELVLNRSRGTAADGAGSSDAAAAPPSVALDATLLDDFRAKCWLGCRRRSARRRLRVRDVAAAARTRRRALAEARTSPERVSAAGGVGRRRRCGKAGVAQADD